MRVTTVLAAALALTLGACGESSEAPDNAARVEAATASEAELAAGADLAGEAARAEQRMQRSAATSLPRTCRRPAMWR
jgi:hypothetical protein